MELVSPRVEYTPLYFKTAILGILRISSGWSSEGVRIPSLSSLKYLRVLLDSRLSWTLYIKWIARKALRAVSVVRVLYRVLWRVSLCLLLLVC